jgi:hypothetical protein
MLHAHCSATTKMQFLKATKSFTHGEHAEKICLRVHSLLLKATIFRIFELKKYTRKVQILKNSSGDLQMS